MMDLDFHFEAELWLYSGKASWYFVTVPNETSEQIRMFQPGRRGFGSVRVRVSIGETNWKTSLFPDRASGCFFLPVKADVRKKEKLGVGDRLAIEIRTNAELF
ncbi:DUF1905 domain-containing protein [Kiloniella sp. b19]|uniref:DUF1905 domain-containing protein n=1 Tax=Kiloniella sp. GXU_MW_B19 TaxID=3141326 RepID=UPI0031D5DB1C